MQEQGPEQVRWTQTGAAGPRVLLLPGLGARGAGFAPLARALASECRPILVEYPTGTAAGVGAAGLARQLFEEIGPVDAVVASSFGGMVAAHLTAAGATRAVAFVGSFTALDQLGGRGPLLRLLGLVAEFARPGPVAAAIAANAGVPRHLVADIVPNTAAERRATLRRAFAIPREPAPPDLRHLPVSCVVLHGDTDYLLPISVMPRLLKVLPAGTPSHVIAGGGHVPYFTHAPVLAQVLRPWLAGLAIADDTLAA
jgi:pimeloyl-ACP methyl ester carboxylesterase